MSQTIEILKCEITADSPEEAERILAQHGIGDKFKVDRTTGDITVEETLEWDDALYFLLIDLSHVARGCILFTDEYAGEDNITKIELKNGEIEEYSAKMDKLGSATLPREVARKQVVLNERYIATRVRNPRDLVVAYDMKRNRWMTTTYVHSLDDLWILEAMCNMEDLADYLYNSNQPSQEVLEEFMKAVLEKYPEAELKLKKILLGTLA